MFKSHFQGGPAFEIFSCQGSSTTGSQHWKFNNKQHVTKLYEKDVKGFCLACEKMGKITLPKDDRQSAYLVQPIIVFQIFVAVGQHLSIELCCSDLTQAKRRYFLSTSNREIKNTALHVSLPLDILRRGVWLNLALDLVSLVSDCFRGQTFRCIESLSLSGSFRLRKIFTMRQLPTETTLSYAFISEKPDNSIGLGAIPRTLQFGSGIEHFTQVINMTKLRAAEKKEIKMLASESKMPSSITSLPPIIAFGSRVSQSTPPLDKPRQKCGSPSSAAADELMAAASHSELSRGPSSSLKVEQAVSLPAESSELPQTGRAKASVRRSRRLSNRKELGKEVVAQGVVQHYDPVRYASSNQTPHLEAVENTATQPHDGSSVTCQGGDTPSEPLHMDAKSPTAPTPEDHLERETSEYLHSRSVEGSGVVSQLMTALDRIITSVDDDTQMADRASPSSRPSRVSWGDKFQIPVQSAGFPIGDHTLDREIPPPEPHPPIKPPSLAERVLAKSRLSSPGWKTRPPSTPTFTHGNHQSDELEESVSQAVSREMEGPASTFDFERQTAALEENLHHGRVDMLTNETSLSGSQANDEGLTPISLQIESTLTSKCSPSPSVSGAADAPENGSNNITELVDDSGLLEKLAIADAGATLQQLAKVAMAAEGDVFAVLDEEGDDDTLELIFDEEADSYLDPKTGKYYLIDEED